jgi:hypothetical protein
LDELFLFKGVFMEIAVKDASADQLLKLGTEPAPEIRKDVIVSQDTDFVNTNSGVVYDVGEPIVDKMNNQNAVFNKDDFFQDLYENYLICVQRHEERIKGDSKIITYWDESTCFEDFLDDALKNIDRQLLAIKTNKNVSKFSILNELKGDIKLDSGSKAVNQTFNNENYDATYELLKLAREAVIKLCKGSSTMIINSQTGKVRITESATN